ncbi:DUF6895 family protein [Luteimonas aquatica]|uniref:DUF6895 family protein n=1 Tax=Luteimonas aquatica TaxID=450364 RepID=UPI001F5AF1E8|nr:hypothetical protein [Luteimonas aquatica]
MGAAIALRGGPAGSVPPAPAETGLRGAFGVDAVFAYLHAHLPLLRQCRAGERAADKAACEIALLCWAVSRNAAAWARLHASAQPLLAWADKRLRGDSVLEAMLWQPSRLPMLALGDGFLSALGRQAPAFARAAAAVREGGLGADGERSPYQGLEVAFGQALCGLGPPPQPRHWLAHSPFLPLLSVDDGYALTHAIFYLTAFGREPLPPGYAAADVHETLENGLWWCLWRRDLDLLAEMLLCALFTGMPATAAVRTAKALLFAAGNLHGHLSAWESLPAPHGATMQFFQLYHPLLVAALLDSELERRAVDWSAATAELAVDIDPGEGDPVAALGISGMRAQLRALQAETFEDAIAGVYGGEIRDALPAQARRQPDTEDWRIALGFVRRDAWTVTAGVAAQLQCGRATACLRHARRWLETLAPVLAARRG